MLALGSRIIDSRDREIIGLACCKAAGGVACVQSNRHGRTIHARLGAHVEVITSYARISAWIPGERSGTVCSRCVESKGHGNGLRAIARPWRADCDSCAIGAGSKTGRRDARTDRVDFRVGGPVRYVQAQP